MQKHLNKLKVILSTRSIQNQFPYSYIKHVAIASGGPGVADPRCGLGRQWHRCGTAARTRRRSLSRPPHRAVPSAKDRAICPGFKWLFVPILESGFGRRVFIPGGRTGTKYPSRYKIFAPCGIRTQDLLPSVWLPYQLT